MLGILSSLSGSFIVVSATLAFCAIVRHYARTFGGLSEVQPLKKKHQS